MCVVACLWVPNEASCRLNRYMCFHIGSLTNGPVVEVRVCVNSWAKYQVFPNKVEGLSRLGATWRVK